ncbi:O-antigen ligase family protein [Virgibacillus sp. FSP13]
MKQVNKKADYERIFFALFFILLLMNTFVRTQLTGLFSIGELSTNLTLFFMFLLLVKSFITNKQYDISLGKVYISLSLLIAIFSLSFLTSNQMESFEFVKLFFLFLFILGAIRIKWHQTHIKIAGYVFSVVILLFFVHWVASGFLIHGFKSVFRNENYLGVLLFSMLYFNILSIKYSRRFERSFFTGILFITAVLIMASGSRSVLIGIAVAVFGWVIMKKFRSKFSYLIYIVLFGNLLFIATYVKLKNTSLGHMLNEWSRSLFEKNLFSGRVEIWEGVIHAILKKPWFGHGVGIRASDVTDINLTAHNLYLQLFLEVGAVGVIFFFAFIIGIWKLLNARLDHYVSRWSACFMLGILVYETLELTLFQNNYSIAMLQWLTITFGVSFVDNDKIAKKSNSRLSHRRYY